MNNGQFYFIFSLFSVIFAYQVTYPLEHDVLESLCVKNDGSKGIFKLAKDCKSDQDVTGFIKFFGAVVCCSRKVEADFNARIFCSKHGVEDPSRLDFHITEGEEAEVSEFPHMVALGYETLDQEIDFDCGGSLISEKFVITAAHCCNVRGKQPKVVRLGRVSKILFKVEKSCLIIFHRLRWI